MFIKSTDIDGLKLLNPQSSSDQRGVFCKLFSNELFLKHSLNIMWEEDFYSVSKKNVVRGMHFQIPPFDQIKLVSCVQGRVLDVVLDLRKSSKTFGMCASFILSAENKNQLYMPSGLAHGFLSLVDDSILCYKVSCGYRKEYDCGILWNSINFDWSVNNPIVSQRDNTFQSFFEYQSPF